MEEDNHKRNDRGIPVESVAIGSSGTGNSSVAYQVSDEGLLRSAQMSLVQLYIPVELAQITIGELGELGVCQFRDLNENISAFQRNYTVEVRRLDEMERKISIAGEEIPLRSWEGVQLRPHAADGPVRNMQQLDELDEQLTMYEGRLKQMEENQEVLEKQHRELCEQRDVLVELSSFLESTDLRRAAASTASSPHNRESSEEVNQENVLVRDGSYGKGGAEDDKSQRLPSGSPTGSPVSRSSLLGLERKSSSSPLNKQPLRRPHHAVSSIGGMSFVAGVVPRSKAEAFERVMWRALRGNIFMRTVSLPEMSELRQRTGGPARARASETVAADKHRSAFIIFCHGRETAERIRRMSVALGCRLVDIPEEQEGRTCRYTDLITRIDDIQSILFNSRQTLRSELCKVSEWLEAWLIGVRRDKGVFLTLNQLSLDAGRRGLVGEAWIPTSDLPAVEAAVQRASAAAGLFAAVPTIISPLPITVAAGPIPTYFRLNRVTAAFQEVNDAYGFPAYGEINPALFMVASFPLLFAVMFGDLGHGVILLLIGLWMVVYEKKLAAKAAREEMFGLVFSGRYVIVLMGLTSMFAGLVYNDCFSKSFRLFPSAYSLDRTTGLVTRNGQRIYPFGMDPIWSRAENGMTLANSYKMKQSILLGVIQMTFGLILSAFNYTAKGDRVGLLGTLLPQLIFFAAFFGYLGVLIVVKWIWPRDVSLIVVFLNMVLGVGKVEGEALFPGQELLQKVLFTLAILCIPWMMLSKPLYMLVGQMRNRMAGYQRADQGPRRTIEHDSQESSKPIENPTTLELEAIDEQTSDSSKGDNNDTAARVVANVADNKMQGENRTSMEGSHEEEGVGDVFMFGMIHTVEFVLGSVSNTASYLRLWALSLAHVRTACVHFLMRF